MWLIPKSQFYPFVQASECLITELELDSNTLALTAEFWLTSSGTPTLRAASWSGWKSRPWSQRLYGPETLRLSDGSDGMALWIASLRASRASRTPWPAAEKAPTTAAGYGPPSQTAFAWFDRGSSSWKTSPGCDLLGEWTPYSQTWPRSGTALNGTAYERQTWEPVTSVSEFSSWPTARSSDGAKGGPNQAGSSGDLMLPSATAQWMAPMVPNGGRAVSAEVVASKGKTDSGKKTVGLESQVRHVLATPDCNTSSYSNGKMGPNIREQAANWPTPDTRDMNGTPRKDSNLAEGGRHGVSLHHAIGAWPTPASRDEKGENSLAHMLRTDGRIHHIDQLPNFVMYHSLHQDQTMNDGQQSSSSTHTSPRRLNPAFASWLMGWPWWWPNPGRISFAQSEMVSYRSRLHSQLSCLLGEQESHREAA